MDGGAGSGGAAGKYFDVWPWVGACESFPHLHALVAWYWTTIADQNGDAQGVHWIVLAVAYGIFGVAFIVVTAIALAYLTDCYNDVRFPTICTPLLYLSSHPPSSHSFSFQQLTCHFVPLQIIGDALVGVVFTRNVFSVIVLFAITPWIEGMGVQNLHVLTACLALAIGLLPVPLLRWGKKARVATADRYRRMALRQPTQRTF